MDKRYRKVSKKASFYPFVCLTFPPLLALYTNQVTMRRWFGALPIIIWVYCASNV